MQENVLLCEDSMEGIFTGIYEAYARKLNHALTRLETAEGEPELFARYLAIEPDDRKAAKVAGTLQREFGMQTYLDISRALASYDTGKAQAVYKTVVQGLLLGSGRSRIMEQLTDPHIRKVFELSRNTNHEVLHWKGFLRFQELENGVLYGSIGAKNNVLTFLMPHFADRLPLENFLIYDEKHNLFGIHPAGKEWYLYQEAENGNMEGMDECGAFHAREEACQELFRHFCHQIAIRERTNWKLQQNMLPLRFQKYMIEFPKEDKV